MIEAVSHGLVPEVAVVLHRKPKREPELRRIHAVALVWLKIRVGAPKIEVDGRFAAVLEGLRCLIEHPVEPAEDPALGARAGVMIADHLLIDPAATKRCERQSDTLLSAGLRCGDHLISDLSRLVVEGVARLRSAATSDLGIDGCGGEIGALR